MRAPKVNFNKFTVEIIQRLFLDQFVQIEMVSGKRFQ